MREARKSKLCHFDIRSFKISLVICLLITNLSVGIIWSRITRTRNEMQTAPTTSTPTTFSSPQHPLLCMFTTFKSNVDKLPIYYNTLLNWKAIDVGRQIKTILYVPNTTINDHLPTYARSLDWVVFAAPKVGTSGLPYFKEMYRHASEQFNRCTFYGYSNGDILHNTDLVLTLDAISKELPVLNRTLVIGRRTNVLLGNGNDSKLYLPEYVTQAAKQRGQLFDPNAEDYFFIAFNDFPWQRVADVVVGRRAYDNYLVGTAIQQNVTVVDATATLLAVHQTDKEGNFAGHNHQDAHFNAIRIGRFNYGIGLTTSAQYVTRFSSDEDCKNCNRTKVRVVSRMRKQATHS